MLHSLSLNKIDKPNGLAAEVSFVTSHASGGAAPPHSVCVKLELAAEVAPSVDGFRMAANGSGVEQNFPGAVEFANAKGLVDYKVEFPHGSLRSWMLELSDNPSAPLKETWTIWEKAPEFMINGAVV